VFAIDFLKGLTAVRVSILIARHTQFPEKWMELIGIVAAVSCVTGHVFPVWLQFKGGKGVATSAGALFGLMPVALLIGAAVWIAMFQVTRYVSVASITAAIALPIVILIMISLDQARTIALLYFSIGLAAMVILRHRSNLSRLVRGTEPRFKRK
jgi:glycerol-3-phosphate acyltransferase PlsY